jgi:hypothetical protein
VCSFLSTPDITDGYAASPTKCGREREVVMKENCQSEEELINILFLFFINLMLQTVKDIN